MLRIMVQEDSTLCSLVLAGRLGGPWVTEMENVWRSAPCSGKKIEVDLREVTAVDGAGRTLLAAMYQGGADLIAQGVEMTALVQEITGEITGKQPATPPKRRRQAKSPTPQEK
jgi:ABC-type transporter Mla MlaB component